MQNNKNMKRENLFPLIMGIILGVLVMLFWQFNMKLNDQRARLAQLEQATSVNSKTLGDIVNFINGATQKAAPAATPAAVPAE